MFYAVINRPPTSITLAIEQFRNKFDYQHKLIPAHITLVFPLRLDGITGDDLKNHLQRVARNTPAFEVSVALSKLSIDNSILLLFKEQASTTRLHDRLYENVLTPYLRNDIKFIPHITVGQFTTIHNDDSNLESKTFYKRAITKLNSIDYKIEYKVDNFELITIDDNFTSVKYIDKFKLGAR